MVSKNKILSGSLIIGASSVVSAILAYLIRIIMANTLTPAEVGLIFGCINLVLMTYFLKSIGIEQAVAKYIPEYVVKKEYDKIKTVTLILFLIQLIGTVAISITLWLLSDWLSINYFHDPRASWVLKFIIFFMIGSLFVKFYKTIFQGFQKMSLFGLIEPIRNGIILLSILLIPAGIIGPLIGYSISGFVVCILLFKQLMKTFNFFKYKIVDFWPLTKKMILFGLPLMFTMMGGELLALFDTFIMIYFRTLTEVGIYNIILPSAMVALLVGRSVSIVIYPKISEYCAKQQYEDIKNIYRWIFKLSLLLIPLFIIGLFCAKFFLVLLFGPEYLPGLTALKILFGACLIFIVAKINLQGVAAMGYPGDNLKAFLWAAAINVGLNLLLIPSYGMNGAAIATLVSYIFIFVYSTWKIKRRVFNHGKIRI